MPKLGQREHISVERERIERAARIYPSNIEAAAALGIAHGSFGRLCRKFVIDTPSARRRKAYEAEKKRRGK